MRKKIELEKQLHEIVTERAEQEAVLTDEQKKKLFQRHCLLANHSGLIRPQIALPACGADVPGGHTAPLDEHCRQPEVCRKTAGSHDTAAVASEPASSGDGLFRQLGNSTAISAFAASGELLIESGCGGQPRPCEKRTGHDGSPSTSCFRRRTWGTVEIPSSVPSFRRRDFSWLLSYRVRIVKKRGKSIHGMLLVGESGGLSSLEARMARPVQRFDGYQRQL